MALTLLQIRPIVLVYLFVLSFPPNSPAFVEWKIEWVQCSPVINELIFVNIIKASNIYKMIYTIIASTCWQINIFHQLLLVWLQQIFENVLLRKLLAPPLRHYQVVGESLSLQHKFKCMVGTIKGENYKERKLQFNPFCLWLPWKSEDKLLIRTHNINVQHFMLSR